MSGARAVCIHGHFYQPPRENPWLASVEVAGLGPPLPRLERADHRRVLRPQRGGAHPRRRRQGSAAGRQQLRAASASTSAHPAELAGAPRSPTSTAPCSPRTASSRERFGGHGSAMAQAYNHMILPLANARDRRTQVAWGVADFEHRFGRRPEGMWLPETAVDVAVAGGAGRGGHPLHRPGAAPGAARAPASTSGPWTDAGAGARHPRAYRCRLPSGRSIALFFYDGAGCRRRSPSSACCASGERFAERLLGGFADGEWPAARPRRHRRRDLRPPPPLRRDGAGLRARLARAARRRPGRRDHQLRRVTSAAPAHLARSRSPRTPPGAAPRRRALAQRLRLPHRRRTGVEPGLARPAARRARLAARRSWRRASSGRAARCSRDPWAARDAYIT